MSPWHAKTEVFEGPLPALVDLIEKRKLLVNDVSLAAVADDFLVYVQSLEKLPHDITADFLLVASTLLLIKSKSLLPLLPVTEEEQASMEDLERRLRAYQHTKEATQLLRPLFGTHMLFATMGIKDRPRVFVPDKQTTKEGIKSVLSLLIAAFPVVKKLEKVNVQPTISLEEVIKNLAERVSRAVRMSFKSFTEEGRGDKASLIISFLAVLQLARDGGLDVNQNAPFSDIDLESRRVGTPRYTKPS